MQNAFECFVTQVQTRLPKSKRVWPMKINVICTVYIYEAYFVVINLYRLGITGSLVLDSSGDREPDYWITDMAPNGSFIKIAEVRNYDTAGTVSMTLHIIILL